MGTFSGFGVVTSSEVLAARQLYLCTMPTELPYAADAEVSLSYDELQVRPCSPSPEHARGRELTVAFHIINLRRFCDYNTRKSRRKRISPSRPSLTMRGGWWRVQWEKTRWKGCSYCKVSDRRLFSFDFALDTFICFIIICHTRNISCWTYTAERMFVLSGTRPLQNGQLRRGKEVQWFAYLELISIFPPCWVYLYLQGSWSTKSQQTCRRSV